MRVLLTKDLRETFGKRMVTFLKNRMVYLMKTVNQFKIGADPEYIALDKAGLHFNVKGYTTMDKEVAYDHNGDVLEVKPMPSRYAFRLVRRIRKLLLEH